MIKLPNRKSDTNEVAQIIYNEIKQNPRAICQSEIAKGHHCDEYIIKAAKGVVLQARRHKNNSPHYNGKIHLCIKHLNRVYADMAEYVAFNDSNEHNRRLFMEYLEKLFLSIQ